MGDSAADFNLERIKVLLVGASEYSNTKWNIPNVAVNIANLQKVFFNNNIFGIPKANLTVLSKKYFTREDFLITLDTFISNVAKDDILVVYYSGHGIFDYSKVQNKYTTFLTTPQSIDRPTISGISIEEFREYIKESPAKRKIIILDCCYSGRIHSGSMNIKTGDSLNQDVTIKLSHVEGSFTMSATSEDQTAGYSPTEPQKPTFFTGALLEVFEEGIENQLPFCSINDVYQEVESRLVEAKKPKPEASSYKRGFEIQILKNKKFIDTVLSNANISIGGAPGSPFQDTSLLSLAETERLYQNKRDTKYFRSQIGIAVTIFLLSVLSAPFARSAYLDKGDSDGALLCSLFLVLSFILLIISFTLAFVAFRKIRIWSMTFVAILLFILQMKTPELAVKFGLSGDRGELGQMYPELTGTVERANDRYSSGDWGSALRIFSLIKARLPKGDPSMCEMKVLLFRAGYYHDKIDNTYSDEILTALNKLKSTYKLPVDGTVYGAQLSNQVGFNTQTILYALAYHEVLGLNIQVAPTLLEIHNAVKAFQSGNNLQMDGDVGPTTLALLYSKFNLNSGVEFMAPKK